MGRLDGDGWEPIVRAVERVLGYMAKFAELSLAEANYSEKGRGGTVSSRLWISWGCMCFRYFKNHLENNTFLE